MNKFYMVYQDGREGRKPRYKHETISRAIDEAVRLASVCPARFLVVEVMGAVAAGENGQISITQAE
jgi:hypothetical protein